MAAARLDIGYSTLKQWIYAGRVRTIETPGGHHRIPAAECARLSSERAPRQRRQRSPIGASAIAVLADSNRLCGCVGEVRSDGLIGQIGLQVGDQRLTAVIPAEALSDLRLRRGDAAVAIIKTTDILLAKVAVQGEKTHSQHRRKT